jgi:acyl-lipid omega-6 desaturase (Delta-12 desaturase)
MSSVAEVRRNLPAARYTKKNSFAVFVLIAELVVYVSVGYVMITLDSVLGKVALATVLGVVIGTMFVIGHDACHDSLTSSSKANRWLARIAFLPSLHSATTWEWRHNRMHHSWTNLRGKDDGYPPFTAQEWKAQSSLTRLTHRLYHTVPLMGLWYMVEVWWKSLILLDAASRKELRTERSFWLELLAIASFVVLQIGLVANFGTWSNVWLEILVCVVWPFMVWNWVMAFVTIQHHTHPRVKWFNDEKQWSYFAAQVGGTVHLRFPRLIEYAFANIFEHTAHHADKAIPFYELRESQTRLEALYPNEVIVCDFSLSHLRYVLRECQLYDFDKQAWARFSSAN